MSPARNRLDSPGLRELAACTRAEADREVPDLLPAAFAELGLLLPPADVLPPANTVPGREAAARALARRMLAGELTARQLASRIHRHFGHEPPLVEQLAALDEAYDVLGHGCPGSRSEIDEEVVAEARRLAL
ncbi:hypothetical protein ACFV1L_09850 [Kitasatospora sp. NPDC059646]|uniref:hypothetical protein n=1 Tax=Kitasatospora sp. NPDC059646 TaxID=3346893 RepID=UPI0036C638BF